MGKILLAILFVLTSVPIYFVYFKRPPPLPEIDLEEWWDSDVPKAKQNEAIRPFRIEFNETMVKDLRRRLRNRRPLTPPLEGVAFEYGFNTRQLEDWLTYWAEGYNFSEREKYLNKYPQFKTYIQGLDVHFIRVTPKVPAGVEVVPLLLTNGWPGSVLNFYEAIPLLTAVQKDRDFAIEVIIPSIPGSGYSSGATKPGLGADKVAVIFRNLMHRLGYKKYYIQGGDWGAGITSAMATFFPDEILGHHTNSPFFLMTYSRAFITLLGLLYPPLAVHADFQERLYPLSTLISYYTEESGYMHIQCTKPDTIGIALTDTPSGLAAYILEKFSTWTKKAYRNVPDGGLTNYYTKDQLIDNLMLYWTSNSITSTMRLYLETFTKRFLSLDLDEIPTKVPTSVLQGKDELFFIPTFALKAKYLNLLSDKYYHDGGNFFALQLPEVFSKEVIESMQLFRQWHKNNKHTEL